MNKNNDLILFLKLKTDIKQELIDYYNGLKFDVDIKVQTLMKQMNENMRHKLIQENLFLIDQIDRVCDSNLNDINEFFSSKIILIMTSSNQYKEIDRPAIKKRKLNNDDESKMKEDIKSMALKRYLIRIQHDKYPIFGLHLEFQWYIDSNQLNFIKYLYVFIKLTVNEYNSQII